VGGAEVQQSLIAPALAARGYKVSMIALDYGQDDRAEVKGVTVHKLYKPDAGIPIVRFVHPRLTTLWRVLGEVGADIYYQRSAAALTGFLAAYCKRHGKRAIYSGASDVDFLPSTRTSGSARPLHLRVRRATAGPHLRAERDAASLGASTSAATRCTSQLLRARRARRRTERLRPVGGDGARAEAPGASSSKLARRMPRQRFVMVGGHDTDRAGLEYIAAFARR
jgi:hypothetical protein